jgi:chromosomal replication initiator protein
VNEIWDSVRTLIGQQIKGDNFERFFGPLRPLELEPHRLRLGVHNEFLRQWIADHYLDVIRECTAQVLCREVEVLLETCEAQSEPLPISAPALPASREHAEALVQPASKVEAEAVPALPNFPLNPSYTFETFVVGPSNQLAFAACESVAANPAQSYNPLYIYGGTGLGKTHLLHAIAHSIRKRDPDLRITYVSAEEFTNQLVTSLRNGAPNNQMHSFRDFYRMRSDVLLVDDVHVLGGKERTQEEFFHTFNALHQARKQVILTSDCAPEEISGLTDRLRSRFNWGLSADVSAPDLETRVAIIERIAAREGLHLPHDVAFLIAGRVRTNVRELEGALVRVAAHALLRNRPITRELVADALASMNSDTERGPTMDLIVQTVASHFDLKVEDLRGQRRHQVVAQPRSIAMYLCRKHVQASYPAIGQQFGGKDHSTVIHACRKIEANLGNDPALQSLIRTIERKLPG